MTVRPVVPSRPGAGGRAAAAALLVMLAVVAVVALPARRAWAQGTEAIHSYNVDIDIERSGDVVVTEEIDYDFGFGQRHGIFRNIPVRFHYDSRYERIYPLNVLSVQGSPGTPDQYQENTSGNDLVLKIGDPDRTITGRHTYTIRYVVQGALNGFEEHDELYWNAIGDEWPVPIDKATVKVRAPGAIGDVACFSGPTGSSLPCGAAEKSDDVATFSSAPIDAHEALTVVVGFPKGLVAPPTPVLDERWTVARAFAVTPVTAGLSMALLIGVAALVAGLLWKTGRDRRYSGSAVDVAFGSETGADQAVPLLERTVTPVEFEPPDKLRPGQVGTLWDEVANPLDVTATIVDLAVRGYLRIDEIPKEGFFGKPDWTLVRLKDGDQKLQRFEALLYDSLFAGGDQVKLSDLKNTFASDLKKVQDALYDDAVAQGWFHARPDKTRTKWQVLAVFALFFASVLAVVLAAFTHAGLLGIPLVIGGVMLLWGAKRMPRRTAKGTGTLRRVQGFRRFIEESEKERARFAERQNLFSEYLPYAIVFGATEKWARAFAGLDGQLPQPTWYTGQGYFTAMSFSNSMDGFTTTTAGTITSTPSGSGSSGFGGGGFSGGGGGGGGGGSW